jgi:indolepyruvate ferredoxin oxidoreductase alpha subunit
MKPLEGLHSCILHGHIFGMAHVMSKALKEKGKGKVWASSRFHVSAFEYPAFGMAYNQVDALIIILDKSTTAMTVCRSIRGRLYADGIETKQV